MDGLSTVDGFVQVNEGLEEMIEYVANEPSVGLFFVQQHAQNAMPILISAKDKIVEKSREVALHTEDLEDSISVVRSMTECGIPIADEMSKDIRKSLHIMSTSQPHKGLIRNPSWGFQMGRDGSQHGSSYFSAVLNSAKQKATALRWSQVESGSKNSMGKKSGSAPTQPISIITTAVDSTLPKTEAEELPLSSNIADNPLDESEADLQSLPVHNLSSMSETYDKFKCDQEAKLEEWLKEAEDCSKQI
ncbi:hypothetical protein QJS10_CPB15g00817 [Acorus calamus]|uniref:Uncharacterized protein n=1 Tax=Acorus calamus TaxID=4465 RepID=A0AAV9D3R6_ACOCL|nr:hypothetical protein QJS10_CPB15g00817 [Acorus calamus]